MSLSSLFYYSIFYIHETIGFCQSLLMDLSSIYSNIQIYWSGYPFAILALYIALVYVKEQTVLLVIVGLAMERERIFTAKNWKVPFFVFTLFEIDKILEIFINETYTKSFCPDWDLYPSKVKLLSYYKGLLNGLEGSTSSSDYILREQRPSSKVTASNPEDSGI